MKKISIILASIYIILCSFVKTYADNDSYETYNEIIMATGKLLANFTEEEMKEYKQYVKKRRAYGVNVYVVNKNIETTYIASTYYSVDNRGSTDVSYELDIVVETSKKTVLKFSGSASGTGKGTIKSFKTDIAAKAGVDYSKTNEESRKETQKFKLTVEKGSRAIVYLMGNARITNGVCSCYIAFIELTNCGFEYFTLINQYPRMEKRKL
ncbi:MAG: hypothetical protein K2I42_02470 [Anaeroplasmataceae bacterium]|nr:hypothetical protein [Anaeroplasmataceae bacterium]